MLPTFGSRRLIREFDLPISHRALERIWREHRLLKKRRRKYEQAGPRAYQSLLGAVPANQRGYQGSRRYPALLAAGPATPLAGHSIHRPRCPQRFAVLGLRGAAQRFGQGRFRLPHPAASGSLRRFAPRSGLANRQRRRVQRRLSQRATWKPCIASKKISSSTWKISPAAATSSPKDPPISCTSISCGPTPTKTTSALGKSSRGSLRAPLNLCLLPPVFLDYHLKDHGGYDVPRLP